ncbi:MAG: hypothetical protein ACR2KP_04615 [Egibacteraceae bacterium]
MRIDLTTTEAHSLELALDGEIDRLGEDPDPLVWDGAYRAALRGVADRLEDVTEEGTMDVAVDWGAAARVAAQCEEAARELRHPANNDELEAVNRGYVAATLEDVDRAIHNAAVSAGAYLGDRASGAVTGENWAGAKARALAGERS